MRRIMLCLLILSLLNLTGCATSEALRRKVKKQSIVIANLNTVVEQLNFQLEELGKAKKELLQTKIELEHKLKKELSQGDLKVQLQKRGLVITLK